jgi:hypothetical protein
LSFDLVAKISSLSPGSLKGLFFDLIASIIRGSFSIPITFQPLSARTAPMTDPM